MKKKEKKDMGIKELIPQINAMNSILSMRKIGDKVLDIDISKNEKMLRDIIRIDTKSKLFPKPKRR